MLQRLKRLLPWALSLLTALLALWAGAYLARHELLRRASHLPPFTHRAAATAEVWVTMRDGVKLHAEVFRPEGVEKAPTVLVRNPYLLLEPLERLNCGLLARYGYACVLQQVRGQMDSQGEWLPIAHEHDDGLDTLQWLVAQSFTDGKLAMRGPSYLACTQWAVAGELPPQVKTLIPLVFGTDLRKVFFERGLFRTDILTAWATLMPTRGMRTLSGDQYLKAARYRPALEADARVLGLKLDWYRDTLRSAAPDAPYWQTPQMTAFRQAPEHTTVPMLLIGGFFDPFFSAQLDSWSRLATRDQSVLVVGPWNHLGMVAGDLSMAIESGRLDQWPLTFEWLEHALKGRPLTTLQPGTVRTLAPGDDQWRSRPQWPAEAAELERWQLADAPASQGCAGGALTLQAAAASSTTYLYRPDDPAPTRGGASLLSFAFYRNLGFRPGAVDQGDSCARADVLTFRGPALEQPRRLQGAASLKLTVSSTAPDTAFVARLIAEQDGKALLVREAAATLAWPDGAATSPHQSTPGEPVELTIDFWPIEWVLPKGSRLRVDVTSSSFPAYGAHPNRAGPWAEATGADEATQTVLVGDHRAVLTLPWAAP